MSGEINGDLIKETKQQRRLNFVTRQSQTVLSNELNQLEREKESILNELERVKKLFLNKYTRYIPQADDNKAEKCNQIRANMLQKRQLLKRKDELTRAAAQNTHYMDIRMFPRIPTIAAISDNVICDSSKLKHYSILLQKPPKSNVPINQQLKISDFKLQFDGKLKTNTYPTSLKANDDGLKRT